MTPQLPQDLENVVDADPVGVLRIKNANGRVYFVLTEEAMQVRHYVHEGIASAERGESQPWDADEMKRDGRARLAELQGDKPTV
jgi:hypothetical protein